MDSESVLIAIWRGIKAILRGRDEQFLSHRCPTGEGNASVVPDPFQKLRLDIVVMQSTEDRVTERAFLE